MEDNFTFPDYFLADLKAAGMDCSRTLVPNMNPDDAMNRLTELIEGHEARLLALLDHGYELRESFLNPAAQNN